jgi:hypothetical protein
MKFDPFTSDEPSIAPPTPGAVLVRLSQVLGKITTFPAFASSTSNAVPNFTPKLASARGALLEALETGQTLGTPFQNAQNTLRELYQTIAQTSEEADQAAENLMHFGFPDPRTVSDASPVSPVDASSVVMTHFKPQRQVFTTFSFGEAHGATAYWLFEIRFLGEEKFVDAVVENYAPQFSRVRLPVGKHRLLIESRNAHRNAHSEEFEIEVPGL